MHSSIYPSIFNRLWAVARYWSDLTPKLGMFPLEFREKFGPQETRIIGLPGSEDSLTIGWAISTQYQRVTDRETDGQTDVQPIAITCAVWLTHVKNDADWIKCCTMMEVDAVSQRDARERRGGMVLERIWRDLDCARRMHRIGVNGEVKSRGQLDNPGLENGH